MAKCRIPKVLLYVREKGGKRSFSRAPEIPDLAACYWLRYEKDGKQIWQQVGHYDSVQREQLLLEKRLSAAAQGFILPEDKASEKPGAARITIQAAVDAYLESLRIKKRPPKSISDKQRDIGYFTAFCKRIHMDEIVSRDMLEFRDHRRTEQYSERTVYNHLMTVTTFLKKNGLYKITGLLEAEDWPELANTNPDPYTEEEMRNLIAAANEFQRLVIRFFVGSGCREQEVAHVEWTDFDWIRKTVGYGNLLGGAGAH
jgi:integrase